MASIDTYSLSRNFTNWAFDNPEKINPTIFAIYFFAIEHSNRLGNKEKFGFPSAMVMEAIGVKNYNTYIKNFNVLVENKFFILIQKSKNQYSSNIIALLKNDKALNKALDKAMVKHTSKQCESTRQSNDSIDKQVNKETSSSSSMQNSTTATNFDFEKPNGHSDFSPEINSYLASKGLAQKPLHQLLEKLYFDTENLGNDVVLVKNNLQPGNYQKCVSLFIAHRIERSHDWQIEKHTNATYKDVRQHFSNTLASVGYQKLLLDFSKVANKISNELNQKKHANVQQSTYSQD